MGDLKIDSDLVIRDMQESDLESVLLIENQAHVQPWSMQVFIDCYHSENACLVAMKSLEVCGHIILSRVLDESHLLNLCVSTKQQGLGVGRRLIDDGIARMHKMGASKMFLEVRRSNNRAINLYQSLGFVEIGVRADYYRGSSLSEDALVFDLKMD